MTADLLKFALEDARSAAVRVQLALDQREEDESRMSTSRPLMYALASLDDAIRMLELANDDAIWMLKRAAEAEKK